MSDPLGPTLSVDTLEYVRALDAVDAPQIAAQARRLCTWLGTACGILLLVCLNLPFSFSSDDTGRWWWQELGEADSGILSLALWFILLAGLSGTFFGAFTKGRVRAWAFISISLIGMVIMLLLFGAQSGLQLPSVLGCYAAAGMLGIAYMRAKGLTVPRSAGWEATFGWILLICSLIVGGLLGLAIIGMVMSQMFTKLLPLWVLGMSSGSFLGYVCAFVASIMAIGSRRPPFSRRQQQVIVVLAFASIALPLLAVMAVTIKASNLFSGAFAWQAFQFVARACVIIVAMLLFLSLGIYEMFTEPCLARLPPAA